jgi:AmmeMemoRadiSam system protein A
VSLHAPDGSLRGCIGTVFPQKPDLAREIVANAESAALRDPRFPAVRPDELDGLEITVDVMGAPERIPSKEDLDPSRYGVIVRKGFRSGLLLPALDGVDTVEEQLSIALRKAGIEPDEDYAIERFESRRYA